MIPLDRALALFALTLQLRGALIEYHRGIRRLLADTVPETTYRARLPGLIAQAREDWQNLIVSHVLLRAGTPNPLERAGDLLDRPEEILRLTDDTPLALRSFLEEIFPAESLT